MRTTCICMFSLFSTLLVASAATSQQTESQETESPETVYWDVVQQIVDEGTENSHIMDDVGWMTDVFGPRVAKSPAFLAAANWAKGRFEEYGLENVRLEPYEFGIGWSLDYVSVHMMTPQYMPVIAYPQSWSSSTNGRVVAKVVCIDFQEIEDESDLDEYRGQLQDTIVFSMPEQKIYLGLTPETELLTDEQLEGMAQVPTTVEMEEQISKINRRSELDHRIQPTYQYPREKIIEFLMAEGVAAIAAPDGFYDDGTVQVTSVGSRPWAPDAKKQPTSLVLAAEHYNRIMRIRERDIPVEMEIDVRVTFSDDDLMGHNVIADIPGTDLADEYVMVGAHFDAHVSGTGANDNATGAAHVLEAARILKAIGVTPRRTIKFALWDGHEVGNPGARAYREKYFIDPETGKHLPDYDKVAGYYNMDYGTGLIRGIYLMKNLQAKPIFEEWMRPFHDMGMRHLFYVPAYDASTEGMDTIGLPAFKFAQDAVENDARTYHTNMDVFDHIEPEYLKQGAIVLASFLYHTAMRDEKLPGRSDIQK